MENKKNLTVSVPEGEGFVKPSSAQKLLTYFKKKFSVADLWKMEKKQHHAEGHRRDLNR